jgi:hypothetical protein
MIEVYEYENNLDDFKNPYKLMGNVDKEVMIDKYKKLTNLSKNVVSIRLLSSVKSY